jgi:hypothetical protein
MGGECSMHGRHEKCIQNLDREHVKGEAFVEDFRWDDNINVDFKVEEWECVN